MYLSTILRPLFRPYIYMNTTVCVKEQVFLFNNFILVQIFLYQYAILEDKLTYYIKKN